VKVVYHWHVVLSTISNICERSNLMPRLNLKPTEKINQLAFVAVSGSQAGDLMQNLTKNGFYFTKIDSSGGIIQEPMVCLLIGFNKSRTEDLMKLSRKYCQPHKQYIPANMSIQPGYTNQIPMIEAQIGGAVIHLLNVERFEQM
jgi:uncharacterized protein YaaQ